MNLLWFCIFVFSIFVFCIFDISCGDTFCPVHSHPQSSFLWKLPIGKDSEHKIKACIYIVANKTGFLETMIHTTVKMKVKSINKFPVHVIPATWSVWLLETGSSVCVLEIRFTHIKVWEAFSSAVKMKGEVAEKSQTLWNFQPSLGSENIWEWSATSNIDICIEMFKLPLKNYICDSSQEAELGGDKHLPYLFGWR